MLPRHTTYEKRFFIDSCVTVFIDFWKPFVPSIYTVLKRIYLCENKTINWAKSQSTGAQLLGILFILKKFKHVTMSCGDLSHGFSEPPTPGADYYWKTGIVWRVLKSTENISINLPLLISFNKNGKLPCQCWMTICCRGRNRISLNEPVGVLGLMFELEKKKIDR